MRPGSIYTILLILLVCANEVTAFLPAALHGPTCAIQQHPQNTYVGAVNLQNDPANERNRVIPIDKTYDNTESFKKNIIIDEEGAMLSFFTSREEWLPLFRSVAGEDIPKDTTSLLNAISSSSLSNSIPLLTLNDLDTLESMNPWKRYNAIPVDEDHRNVVARFLDSMQESLLAIPVTDEATGSSSLESDDVDESELQFVEEGRRLLAINRFHVISNNVGAETNDCSSIESVDELFRHCWSEIFVLSKEGVANSGSLILLPEQYELPNIRQFLDMNVVQPLQWLGIHDDYEISSFHRDSLVIRLIYKLNDIPSTSAYTDEDGFATTNDQ
jgi:hypothetical protein